MRFTLEKDRWYACEIIGDEFGEDLCSYSPIKILNITPLKTGNSEMELYFYHANYPEGVRDKRYSIKIIERARSFILAVSTEHKNSRRFLQIYDIDGDWMKRHFKMSVEKKSDIQDWLTRNL